MLREIRMARIVDAIGRYRHGRLSCVDAALALGMSERHFRRLRDTYEAEGAEGLIDKRRGRVSGRGAGVDEIEWVIEAFTTHYFDCNAKHFHEAITAVPRPNGLPFARGYTWTKSLLQQRGLTSRAKLRGVHRKKRVRKPLPGMMLFQDGSTHTWLVGQPPLDLIVTMDDATSEIYSIFLVGEEGTASSFEGLRETIERHGLFSSFYTDRGSHYFSTPEADGKVDQVNLTQVGRALEQLGIEHIPSYSPQGRGRMERVFGTLQGRLPQELRMAGITTLEAANLWLATTYGAAHNARFGVKAAEEGTAFVPFVGELANILCLHSGRVVGNDNCVRYQGLTLQIPEQAHKRHFVRAKVRVHEYQDGSLALFQGPRCLARYTADGALRTATQQKHAITKSAA
jgi:transposase InsO family protein